MMRYCVLLLATLTGLFGCSKKAPVASSGYYNFDSLIQSQMRLLTLGDTLEKVTQLADKTAPVRLKLDSALFSRELEIFRSLDVINRVAYKGLYDKQVGLSDPQSNLKIISLKATEESIIPQVLIYYQEQDRRIRKIEADFKESNSLYSTKRKMLLNFDQIGDQTLLTEYSVIGTQKMILSDSVSFQINGKVIRSNK